MYANLRKFPDKSVFGKFEAPSFCEFASGSCDLLSLNKDNDKDIYIMCSSGLHNVIIFYN